MNADQQNQIRFRMQRDIQELARRIARDMRHFDPIDLLNALNDISTAAAVSEAAHAAAPDGFVQKFRYLRNLLLKLPLPKARRRPTGSIRALFENVDRLYRKIGTQFMAQAHAASESTPERNASIEAWLYSRTRDLLEPPLGSGEQFRALFLDRFENFDSQIVEPSLGLTCMECISVIDRIGTIISHRLGQRAKRQRFAAAETAFDEAVVEGKAITRHLYVVTAQEICAATGIDGDHPVTLSDDQVSRFLERTAVIPGGVNGDYALPTDKPCQAMFARLNDGQFYILDFTSGYRTLFHNAESALGHASDSMREKYYKWRGKIVPANVTATLEGVFGKENVHTNLHYNPSGQKGDLAEADILVRAGTDIILCEVKGHEANRSIHKQVGYERMLKEFSTIQEGYDQCKRTHDYMLGSRLVQFWDSKMKTVVLEVEGNDRGYHYLVITANSFGSLGGDCTRLLKRDSGSQMPVVMSEFDFRTASKIINTPDILIRYLAQRVMLHGRLSTSDELEVAGAFVTYGMSLNRVLLAIDGESREDQPALLVLDGSYSFIFNGDGWAHDEPGEGVPELVLTPVTLETLKHGL